MRILICCNAGMSSSIIMQKMRDAAAKRNMELTCEAKLVDDLLQNYKVKPKR